MRSFSAGDVIYREGDPCECAYMIISGEVDILIKGDKYFAGKDEILGSLSLIRNEAYRETVIARTPVTLSPLNLEQVEEMVTRKPVPHPVTMDPMEQILSLIDKLNDKIDGKFTPPYSDKRTAYSEASDSLAIQSQGPTQTDLSPISKLIEDDTINDILINGHNDVFVERSGILEHTNVKFKNDTEVFKLATNILKDLGRKIDHDRPLVDARLLDGSRVNIIAPPLSVDGTSISIRKFSKKKITLDSMIAANNMSVEVAEFLKVVGKCRLNIVISGGTGSGKTTLLNAISQYIDENERIVTIEDAAELRLQQPHVVRLETRPHHIGMKADEDVSMRDLVKNALRMRPDRIIVGEVRGTEAFDMLQAMNSGHEGSLTTVHANHPRDALSRLENMISMTDLQIPMKSLRYQIASALHLIIQISRMRDGARRITYISEVVGMEGDMITMHDLFNFKQEGEDSNGKIIGKYKWSGIMPRFVRRIEYYGGIASLENALGVKFPKNALSGKH